MRMPGVSTRRKLYQAFPYLVAAAVLLGLVSEAQVTQVAATIAAVLSAVGNVMAYLNTPAD